MVKLPKFIQYHRLKRLASINPFGNIMPGALVEKWAFAAAYSRGKWPMLSLWQNLVVAKEHFSTSNGIYLTQFGQFMEL